MKADDEGRCESQPRPDRQLLDQRADRQPGAHRLVLPAALRRRPGVPCAARFGRRHRRRRQLAGGAGQPGAQRTGLRREHRRAAHAPVRRAGRRRRDRRFRAALLPPRAGVPADAAGAAAAADPGHAAHPAAGAPACRLGPHDAGPHARQPPHPLRRAGADAATDHERADHLRAGRIELHAQRPDQPAAGCRRGAGRRHRGERALARGAHGAVLAPLDRGAWRCRWSGSRPSSARPSR